MALVLHRSRGSRPILAAGFAFFLIAASGRSAGSPRDELQQLLDSGDLARSDNPVAANFLIEQGRGILSAADEQRATEQIQLSLRRQTGFMSRIAEGALGAMSGRTMQQLREQQQSQGAAQSMLGGLLGVAPAAPSISQRQQQQMQQEMQEGMAGPWIRGVESARAMEQLGEAQAAGRFYMNCLQMDPAEWFAEVCLNGILQMGPARAGALLNYIVDSAEQASIGALAAQAGNPSVGAVPMRSAALRGLGSLIGEGKLGTGDREQAFNKLLRYADGKDNVAYYPAAAAGLGRSRDPRAVGPLRRLVKYRKDPRVAEEAWRGLAVGFADEEARERLREFLDDEDLQVRMRAGRALFEAGDEAAFSWAVAEVTDTRSAEATQADPRPRIVRELAGTGSARARQALQQIQAKKAGNDWLQAWTAVALLELGDDAQLPAVRAALHKTDWALDRSGIGALWGRISPLLNLALSAYMGQLNVMQAVQTVGNMIAQERAKLQQKASERDLVGLQLRWQGADALATSRDPGAIDELGALLGDPEPSVRMGAARALAVSASPAAFDLIPRAMAADFGSTGSEARSPQVRAALLRAAVARYPTDPRTRAMCVAAAGDADAGVRFIALVSLQKS